MATVRVQLPTTCDDTRVDKVRVYRIEPEGSFSRIAEVDLGTVEYRDGFADYGACYYISFYDSLNQNESVGSPLTRIFRRNTNTLGVF